MADRAWDYGREIIIGGHTGLMRWYKILVGSASSSPSWNAAPHTLAQYRTRCSRPSLSTAPRIAAYGFSVPHSAAPSALMISVPHSAAPYPISGPHTAQKPALSVPTSHGKTERLGSKVYLGSRV
eukprot:243382-Rhodomonas_salina.1